MMVLVKAPAKLALTTITDTITACAAREELQAGRSLDCRFQVPMTKPVDQKCFPLIFSAVFLLLAFSNPLGKE